MKLTPAQHKAIELMALREQQYVENFGKGKDVYAYYGFSGKREICTKLNENLTIRLLPNLWERDNKITSRTINSLIDKGLIVKKHSRFGYLGTYYDIWLSDLAWQYLDKPKPELEIDVSPAQVNDIVRSLKSGIWYRLTYIHQDYKNGVYIYTLVRLGFENVQCETTDPNLFEKVNLADYENTF